MSFSSTHRLDPSKSDINFKKSCEIILQKMKSFNIRVLNNILVNDDPKKPFIDDDKHTYIWYLAIGSMTNPISLYLRDLTPLLSYPAKCPNYRLVFREPDGMADIQPCKGEKFHGVVHLVPIKQMNRLDKIEHMYTRTVVKIIDYQKRSHFVYVYQMNLIDQKERPISTPSERYLDLIVKGCEYFGVRASHINHLKSNQSVIPRKSPSTYETINNIPDNINYSNEDLLKHNGKDPLLPLWISINGKILEYKGLPSNDHPDYDNKKRFYDFVISCLSGRDVSYVVSRAWYEPMYKLPLTEDDLTDEHRAFAEDMCVSWGLVNSNNNRESYWKPIGRLFPIPVTDKSK